MAKVITIARQIGSLGDEIAQAIAEELGVPLLDREIVIRAATLAGVSEESISEAEHVPPFLERMVSLLGQFPATWDVDIQTPDSPPPALSTYEYRALVEDVIRGIAQTTGAVIVGHSGQIALKERSDVLKVLVCAPLKTRVGRVKQENEHQAEEAVKHDDAERNNYYHSHYHLDWLDPLLYDLAINTQHLDVQTGKDIVLSTGSHIRLW